jgi:hypothetical protein
VSPAGSLRDITGLLEIKARMTEMTEIRNRKQLNLNELKIKDKIEGFLTSFSHANTPGVLRLWRFASAAISSLAGSAGSCGYPSVRNERIPQCRFRESRTNLAAADRWLG